MTEQKDYKMKLLSQYHEKSDTTNDEDNLSKNLEHLAIVKASNKSSIAYMISAFSLVTFAMWIRCIWVLYARTFFININHDDDTEIDIMLYAGYFVNAITSLTNGILSDKFGCDKMLFIIVSLWQIGFLLQAFAGNFIIYSIGWIIFNLGGGYVTIPFAYIAKMIPHNTAVKYQGIIYAAVFCAVCVGPITSGLISHYINYQWSLILVSILNGILFIYILINNIYNKQSNLLLLQLNFEEIYKRIISDYGNDEESLKDIEENYFFPMLYDKIKKQQTAIEKKQIQDTGSSQASTSKISDSRKVWIKFIGILLSFSFVNANEGIFDAYYTVYCHDRFSINIMLSTVQLSLTSIPLVIGFIFVPKLYDKYALLNKNKFYIMIMLYILLLFLLFVVFPQWMDEYVYYWFILPGYNVLLASLMMNIEILCLELQPKSASGLVNGVRALLKQLLSAFSILLVSLMWSPDNNYVWMWYGPALFVSVGFLACLVSNCIAMLI